jgi:uncharacterized repeat protein (TIGR01451 family)
VLLLAAALAPGQTDGDGRRVIAVAQPYQPPPPPPPPKVEKSSPLKQVSFQPEAVAPVPAHGSTLSLEVTGPESVASDQPAAYEIIVRNAGDAALNGVRVEEVLPPGALYRSAEPTAQVQNNRLTWDLGNLDPGAERRIKLEIQPGDAAEIEMKPAVTFAAAKPVRTRVARPPLVVTQTVEQTVSRGSPVTFRIQLTNNGDQPINDIVLQVAPSPGLEFIPGHRTEPGLASLAPGETKTVTLDAKAVQAGQLTNVVTATAPGGWRAESRASINVNEEAPPPPKIEQVQAVQPEGAPPVTLEIVRHDEAIDLGAESVYEVRVHNRGTAAVTGMRLSASVAEGLQVLKAEGPTRELMQPKLIVFEPLPQLSPNAVVVYHLHVKGQAPGDWSVLVQATADTMLKPLVKQVRTRVVVR